MDPSNRTHISFEERHGDIFVTVVDKYKDGHIHKLNYAGVSKQEALAVLKQKQSELETRE
jgi:hypothetical protein